MPSRLRTRSYTSSILFNGSTSGLVKASPVGINTGTNSVTVAAWVYLTSDALGTVCALETLTANTRSMLLGQISNIYYMFSDGVSVNITVSAGLFRARIGTFKWRRVVYSTNGTNIDIWVDGVLLTSQTMSINTNALTNLFLGRRTIGGVAGQVLSGYLKDVSIFNNYFSLSDAEKDYFDAVRPYAPVSSFQMEEGSGTAVADDAGSNSLTATAISWSSLILPMSARVLLTDTDRFIQRSIVSSLDVATNAGILVNNTASLNPTDYVALEIWCKPVPGQNIVLFDNSTSGVTNSYFLLVGGDGSLAWYSTIGGIVKNIIGTTGKLRQWQWNFVSATYDGTNITLMANGSVFATLAATGTLGTNSGQLRIGQYYNTGVPVQGWITQPRIYHRNDYTIATHRLRYYNNRDDATMRAGLVLDMPCNEGGGTSVADVSGQGNNGTFSRAIWNTATPFTDRFIIRNVASSYRADGISNYIDLGSSGAIAAATTVFSCAVWFKRDKQTGINAMVGDNNNAAQNHWNFQTQGPNRKLLTTLITSVGPKALVGGTNIPANTWCHAVLTYDGAFIRFYFNGYMDAITTHTGTVLASTSGVQIASGSAPVGGAYRFFGGWMQDLKYWTRVLTAQDAYDLAINNRNDAAMRTNLMGEWLLISDALDTSGQGNHGTQFGGFYDTTDAPFKDRVLL